MEHKRNVLITAVVTFSVSYHKSPMIAEIIILIRGSKNQQSTPISYKNKEIFRVNQCWGKKYKRIYSISKKMIINNFVTHTVLRTV